MKQWRLMLEQFEAFYLIVKLKNFTKAAKQLGISTPMVTRRLAKLEETMGTRLINRNTRKLSVTEAGEIFFQEVGEILQRIEHSKNLVRNLTHEVIGTLKIGIPITLNHLYLSPEIHRFIQQYPGLNLHIVNGNHLLNLLDNDFDSVIHCSHLPDSNFHFRKLGMWSKVTCASPGYLAQHGKPQQPKDLAAHNCLDHHDNHHSTWKFQVAEKIQEVYVAGNLKMNSSIDLKNAAVNDAGIVYLPSFTVHRELEEGNLISILSEYQPPCIPMCAIYPSQQFLSKKVQVFLDFFTEIMAPVLKR